MAHFDRYTRVEALPYTPQDSESESDSENDKNLTFKKCSFEEEEENQPTKQKKQP